MAGSCAVTENSQTEHEAFQSSGLSNGFSDRYWICTEWQTHASLQRHCCLLLPS